MNPLLIELPDEIATAILLLRAAGVEEAADLNAEIQESISELKPWLPWAQQIPTPQETVAYCRRALAEHVLREEITCRLYLRESRAFAGAIWLTRLNGNVPSYEMGYWTRTSLSARGLMSEAVAALNGLGFETLGAKRIEIRTDEMNLRSRKVAERTGYLLEAVLRNCHRFPGDTLRNICVYSKVNS